jgi:sec-independent protein translocase protein TatC
MAPPLSTLKTLPQKRKLHMTDHFTEEQESQPLVSHLKELRDRLLRCIYVTVGLFLCMVYFSNDIYAFITGPLTALLREFNEGSLIATDVTASFVAPLKLTFYISLFITMPHTIYQVWAFIAPALYRHEKRLAIPLFISSVLLFYIGAAFANFVIIPGAFKFFMLFAPSNVSVNPDITMVLDFIIKVSLAFGAAFEIPVAVVILLVTGITTADALIAKRPYVIVGCFVVAMFLTPPDVASQLMMAFPLWGLFECGVYFGRWIVNSRQKDDLPDYE